MKIPWVLLIAVISAVAGSHSTNEGPMFDYAGLRFRCGELLGSQLCVDPIPEASLLVIVSSEPNALPQEPHQIVMLCTKAKASSCSVDGVVVHGPAELAGIVSIENGKQALEYLRLFSSYWTFHLFADEQVEILRQVEVADECLSPCFPQDRWEALGFEGPKVTLTSEGFLVTRFVVRARPGTFQVDAYRVKELVKHSGAVTEISAERIELCLDDQARLTLPIFM